MDRLPVSDAFSLISLGPMNMLGAVSESWITRWLTSFWLVGVGVAIGFAVLTVFVALFYFLSKLSILEQWRRNGVAFWGVLIASAVLTALLSIPMQSLFEFRNGFRNDEWLLFSVSLFPLVAILVGALVYCGQTRFMGELYGSITRGIGAQLTLALAAIGILGLCCTFVVDEPVPMLANLASLFGRGETSASFTLPGIGIDSDTAKAEFVPLPLKYDPQFIDRVVVFSDKNVILADGNDPLLFREKPLNLEAKTEIDWNRQSSFPSPIPMFVGGNVFAQNLEIDPATITFSITTVPAHPQVFTCFVIAVVVILIGLAWMLQQAAAPKTAAIAMAAAKSELSQPLPLILMTIGAVFLVLFVFLPFGTQGEDIKMLKDCSLTLILVICLFQGVWSASSSVCDEIEGRTALTLLSKPIHRRSFILGKMLGVFWILLFLLLIMGGILLLTVTYKPIYDARESSLDMPLWQQCHLEMFRTLPGLVMVLLQASTLSAIAVALATRVPLLANFAICFTLYLIGHLTPSIVSSASDGFPIIQFIAQLIAVVVPTLDWYSMDKAIDSGHSIPAVYLSGVLVYSALYVAFAVFLGLLLFEDRDLA